jgi:hypothetical protein
MLRFITDVRLHTNANSAEVVSRLAGLVAPPFAVAPQQRRKPLRGRVSVEGGFLRWPLNEYRFISPRNLSFKLIESNQGTALVGKFAILNPLRIVVLAWLTCGLGVWSWILIGDLIHQSGTKKITMDLLVMLIGICMATGYLWLTVRLGKRRDADLVRVLRIVLTSDRAAAIAADLLTQPSSGEVNFIDLPPL